MAFKIVRNDIVKMQTEAIVNTANDHPTVGTGCDHAVYRAAGYDELLRYRKEHIGFVEKSLALAKENHIKSIAFPLISTGGFGYPKEEGMRIALDEIYDFLFDNDMDIYLVVFDTKAVMLGEKLYPDLETYIDHNYVLEKSEEEYNEPVCEATEPYETYEDDSGKLKRKLDERKAHMADTFSEYLLYLITEKGMTNVEVYKRAIVDRKLFAKIKNDPTYHPQKLTCLCLCVGAKLNLDETRDLLARAGYALSPCDMRDVIFSYFIENEIYDMIDLDIQLEEYGIPCIIA